MKNFQQTPKQRRVALEKNKRQLAHSKQPFQPREAWGDKKKVGGVPVCILQAKAAGAGSNGAYGHSSNNSFFGWW
jgi:hypothetical protein